MPHESARSPPSCFILNVNSVKWYTAERCAPLLYLESYSHVCFSLSIHLHTVSPIVVTSRQDHCGVYGIIHPSWVFTWIFSLANLSIDGGHKLQASGCNGVVITKGPLVDLCSLKDELTVRGDLKLTQQCWGGRSTQIFYFKSKVK